MLKNLLHIWRVWRLRWYPQLEFQVFNNQFQIRRQPRWRGQSTSAVIAFPWGLLTNSRRIDILLGEEDTDTRVRLMSVNLAPVRLPTMRDHPDTKIRFHCPVVSEKPTQLPGGIPSPVRQVTYKVSLRNPSLGLDELIHFTFWVHANWVEDDRLKYLWYPVISVPPEWKTKILLNS